MKPVSKYNFSFALSQRAINLTAICVVTTALAACGGSSGGGSEEGGSETQDLLTDPNLDSDGDGLSDIDEETIYFTDPQLQDTDGDAIFDGEEIDFGLDPNDASDAAGDLDGDGVSNFQEIIDETDPLSAASFIPGNVGDSGATTPVAVTNCDDLNSSNSDWGDNCELSRFGVFSDSLYTRGVQRILWCQGFTNGLTFEAFTDGEFGPGTEQAVLAFQTAEPTLSADGVIGPQSWAALRDKVVILDGPDVIINNTAYTAHVIKGCEFDGEQFYQEVTNNVLGGWKMAATPGSTSLVDFSTGSPF